MTWTVWLDGNRIGDTDLELRHGQDRRAGIFHPTELGLTVLPGITAMAPALLDVGRISRESGIDTEDPDVDIGEVAEGLFATHEGLRVIAAAREISRLELRDPSGRLVTWKSMLITDMNDFADHVLQRTPPRADILPDIPPIRYFISAKITGGFRERLLSRAKKMVS